MTQRRFAAAAAAWATEAASHVPPIEEPDDAWKRVELRTRSVARPLPDRGDPGGTRAPLKKERRTAQGPETEDGRRRERRAPAMRATRDTGPIPRLTTASSTPRISPAARNSPQFRAKLDAELTSVRSVVARLAKRLLRVLMAKPGSRMALRSRRRTARRVAPGEARREPRRRPAVQTGKRIAVSEHRRDAADRSLGIDARPADADCGADGGDLRARARALRRQMRGARVHHARMGRRRARARVGGRTAIPNNPAGSTPSSTSSSRAPTCPGAGRASPSGCSSTTRC